MQVKLVFSVFIIFYKVINKSFNYTHNLTFLY